ncbi:hypothetical protein [Sphingomonas crocodyli]|uniref:Uncharacterized protein n=1 Tax=Sphingomonas crocodyli TaxID=1979270 RepID=A0A437M5X7_9SPHN|nr:hypothetical protein [Sphingomonas crocodyli]RVT92993.1 hypothetical protein EOD43_03565 [Sphingomonas crocodyli]
MRINIFGCEEPDLPLGFDVNINRLPRPIADLAKAGIGSRMLRYYTSPRLETWVDYVALVSHAGLGRRLHDPESIYFVPPTAKRRIAYWDDPVDEADPKVLTMDIQALVAARERAKTLHQMSKYLPPWPYDLRVAWFADGDLPLAELIKAGRLDAYPGGRCWWVRAAEAAELLPAGESFDDPSSDWYVSPHDRADHDEMARLLSEHRQNWPEA